MDEHSGEEAEGFGLNDVWAILQMQRNVVLASTVASTALVLVYLAFATRLYKSTAVLMLSTAAGQEIQTQRVVDMDQYHRWNRSMFVRTQIEVMRSRQLRTKVLTEYARLHPEASLGPDEGGIMMLGGALNIVQRQGTELLDLSVTTPDPELSAELANLVAWQYQQHNLDVLTESAVGARTWLEEQLGEYETRVFTASQQLLDFQREHDLADAEEDVTALSATMGSFNSAYGEAQTERVLQETRVATHEKFLRQGDYAELAKDMNTPLMASLMADYSAAVTNQARVAAVFLEKAPERKVADAELDRIEAELRSEVRRTLSAEKARLELLRAKELRLEEAIQKGKGDLLLSQQSREEYEKLRLSLQRAKEFYARLGERRDELDLQSKTQLNNVQVVEQARPPKGAASPKMLVSLAGGVGGGLVLGLMLGLAREYFDDTISSPLEVTTFLRARFLGMVPKVDVDDGSREEQALYTHHNPRSAVAEAMRGIRTTIELGHLSGPPRRLLVTSAVASEGKTSTIVRFGVAFANLQRKVLLIDGDLRRPRLHRVFGVERTPGFAALLHHEASIAEAVAPTAVEGLFVLPSGKGGERPNELLASPRVVETLDRLGEEFDLILIDTPPSVLLADARILSRLVDGCVVVVREHTTSRALVREAVRGLEQVGATVLGVVINAVDFSRRRTSYKYYYGYGYRYEKYYQDEPDAPDAAE